MLNALASMLGSRLKAAQVFLVLAGKKPAARFTVPEQNLSSFASFCEVHGLVHLLGSLKVPLGEEGYQDGAVAIPRTDKKKGSIIVYLAKDLTKALAVKAGEELGDHRQMGEELGYPRCCIDAFLKHHQEERGRDLDFLRPMTAYSKRKAYPFIMNLFARYQDAGFLFHCPCSLDCQKSQEMAEINFKTIAREDRDFGNEMRMAMIGKEKYGNKTYLFS